MKRMVAPGEVRVPSPVMMHRVVVMMSRSAVIMHPAATTGTTAARAAPSVVTSAAEVPGTTGPAATGGTAHPPAEATSATSVPDTTEPPGVDHLRQTAQAHYDQGQNRPPDTTLDPARCAPHGRPPV